MSNTFEARHQGAAARQRRTALNSDGSDASDVPLLGPPELAVQELFDAERFPNVVVTLDGTILATWGAQNVVVRRSEDGGGTWGPEIAVGMGIHAGGVTVDESTGEVLVFVHPTHPPKDGVLASRTMYHSGDGGKTWKPEEVVFPEDVNGYVPSLHMSDHGITLRHGPHAGRLLRPARVYLSPGGYNTSIYSDDHGATWASGEPFPVKGTGEGAVAELSDGRIYYSSRQHFFPDGEPFRHDRLHAWSHDGGKTWTDPGYHQTVPDGPRYRGEERRGACYNGHFGMMAGLVRLPIAGRDVLIYSNADEAGHERVRMTAWASFDAGTTWPVKRLVDQGPSAYSSLAAGRPGTPSEGWIFLQYEERSGGGRLARFNLPWLLAGERTGDGDVPDWLA